MFKHWIAPIPRLSRRSVVAGGCTIVLSLAAFIGFKSTPPAPAAVAITTARPQPNNATHTPPRDEQKMQQVVEEEHARAAKARVAAQEQMFALRKHQAEQARQEAMARAQAEAFITQQREKLLRERRAAQQSEQTNPTPSHP